MQYSDDCFFEGRLYGTQRRCVVHGMTGYTVCPGDCRHKLTFTDIEIRRGECINRGHRMGGATGWTRQDCV